MTMKRTLDIALLKDRDDVVPVSFASFDLKKDNDVCLQIYYDLLRAFAECEKGAEPFRNLIGVFFPDIMRFLTGVYLRTSELAQSNLSVEETELYAEAREYPYFWYHELLHGMQNIECNVYPDSKISQSLSARLLNHVGPFLYRGKRVAFHGTLKERRYVIRALTKLGICPVFPTVAQIYIPDLERQRMVLNNFFDVIIDSLKLPLEPQTVKDVFALFTRSFLSEGREQKVSDLLVTGTMMQRESRVLAAQACAQNKPVITIGHGDGIEMISDHPVSGYCDLSYTTHFIGYGEVGEEVFSSLALAHSLYEKPKYIPANSNICAAVFDRSKQIPELRTVKDPRYMYVPTAFAGRVRYGPFMALPDVLYYDWQKKVADLFPDAVCKVHPKLEFANAGFSELVTDFFEDVFHDADVFLFDYYSTAFNIAAATDKPIIFFYHGVRNFVDGVLDRIKDRCIWVDVREQTDGEYIRSSIAAQRDKRCINRFTDTYCISQKKEKREDTLIRLVQNVVSGDA